MSYEPCLKKVAGKEVRPSIALKINYFTAFKYYTKGCQLNDASSCSSLETAYHLEQGVRQDYDKSGVFYLKAYKLKDSIACIELNILGLELEHKKTGLSARKKNTMD